MSGPATITFHDIALEAGEPPPAAVWSRQPGSRLHIAAGAVEDGNLVIRTRHFSTWSLLDWSDTLAGLIGKLSLTDESPPPQCSGEQEVRAAGWRVTSDSGTRIKWCLGGSTHLPILRVTNSRGYAVAAELTQGLHRSLRSTIDDLIKALNPLFRDQPSLRTNSVTWLAAGETADIQVVGRGREGVSVRPSTPAYLISALQYAVDTLSLILDRTGQSRSPATILSALQVESCLVGYFDMVNGDITTAHQAAGYLTTALSTTLGCAEDAVGDLGLGLGGVLVQGIVWVLSGLNTAINGIVAAVDSVLVPDGYKIEVTGPPAIPSVSRTIRVSNNAHFVSPSGNITCYMREDSVRCAIREFDWEVPEQPPSCQLEYGPDMGFDGFACVGDTIWYGASLRLGMSRSGVRWHTSKDPVVRDSYLGPLAGLDYGVRITNGQVRCDSLETGVTCTRSSDGARVSLSQSAYSFE